MALFAQMDIRWKLAGHFADIRMDIMVEWTILKQCPFYKDIKQKKQTWHWKMKFQDCEAISGKTGLLVWEV